MNKKNQKITTKTYQFFIAVFCICFVFIDFFKYFFFNLNFRLKLKVFYYYTFYLFKLMDSGRGKRGNPYNDFK